MHGTWQTHDILGHPADVYELPSSSTPRFGVLFLHSHGLETLTGNTTFTRLFDELGLACVCPHGKRSWWTDRLCPEFDPQRSPERWLLDAVIPFFHHRWGLSEPGIGLLGVSMGGQGALRLAFRHPRRFPVVAGIASAIEFQNWYGLGYPLDEMYDSKEQARQDTALLHVQPYDAPPHLFFCVDPRDVEWWRGNDRLHEKLTALGIEHHCDLSTSAGGHDSTYFNTQAERAVRFLHEGLTKMSRRLL